MTTLKKIDKNSVEGVESSLNLFEVPPSNVAINKNAIRELLPLSTITQDGPYLFRVFADNQFIDLSKTWLYLQTSIEKKNATGEWVPIEKTNKNVGVCQNIGQSFVRQLKISLNNVECFDSGNLYAYRAYILQELGRSIEVKKGLYEAYGYFPDDNDQNKVDGSGFQSRVKKYAEGSVVETMVKLDFDLAQQENLILNNTDIVFTVYRNPDQFLILSLEPDDKTEYRLKVHNIKLYVRTVDVTQSLNNAISRHLEKTPAKYALRKIAVRNFFIGKGRTEFAHNVFNSVCPRRMIIGFVSSDAFTGSQKLSPFVFEHANIRSICVEANGLSYPAVSYDLDFKKGKYIRAFVDLYSGLGLDSLNQTVGISAYRFTKAWCFFVINMTATGDDSTGFEIIKNGSATIKAAFHEPIKDIGYEMIVLAEFDQILALDGSRVLTADGSI